MKIFKPKILWEQIINYWNQDVYKATILRFITIGFRSVIAFLFWIVVGYFFTSEGIGEMSSVVSVLRLGAIFTMFGIQTAFLKFPIYSFKKKQLATISLIPIALNILFAIIFVLGFDYLRLLIGISKFYWFIFTFLSTLVVSFFLIFDDVLVGIKSPFFLLVKEIISNTILFSGIAILAFTNFIPNTELSMLILWVVSQLTSILIAALFIILKKKNRKEEERENEKNIPLKKFISFSFSNHTGTLIQSLPMLLTTPLVIKLFNAEDAAFIYVAWSILGLLASFPNSLSFVLITEKRDSTLKSLLNRLKFAYIIETIIVVPLLSLQKYIFLLFDLQYSSDYFWSLLLVVLSIYPLSIFLIYMSALRQRNEKGMLQILFAIQSVIYFVCIFIFKPILDIISINFSWFLSTLILAGISLYLSSRKKSHDQPDLNNLTENLK